MNLTTPRKKFLTRNSYLLVIAAWLITISFIIDNYWGSTSTPSGIQKILQKDIQSKEKSFANLCQDRVLLNQLIAHQYNEQTLTDLNKKKYFIFIYSIDTSLQNTPLFWNTQIVQPDESVTSSPDTNNISLLSNGWYVCNKKIFLANDGVSYKIIALIPVKWDYYIQNKYLQNSFAAVKNVENEFTVSRLPDKIAIKDADGKILFYLHENNIIAAGNINQFTLWLRIVAALLTLLFINGAANFYIEKKGLLTGSLILIISFLALRIFSYFIPIPFNLRQAELFDPAVYGSTPVLRSLGDLFINAVLFAWIILFLRYHISEKNLQIKTSSRLAKNAIVFLGGAIMISVTLVAGHIISSLVADSQISFDVINFYTLDIYTIVGFVVLCCLAIGYFFFNSDAHIHN